MLKDVPRSCREFYFKCLSWGQIPKKKEEEEAKTEQFKADCTFLFGKCKHPHPAGELDTLV